MSKLDDYILEVYAADPTGAVGFANKHYRLVHISRRWWRGYKVMSDAEVKHNNKPVAEDNATKSRWKLVPDEVREMFQDLERETDRVLQRYCVSGGGNGEATPVITGGGNYVVPADTWPRVQGLLVTIRKEWSEAADRWCTEEGYTELHALVADKFGDEYPSVKDFIPPRDELRGKFGLIVAEVPVRIVEDEDLGAEAQSDRARVFAEMVSASVRRPRLEAADVWEALAEKLAINGPGGTVIARMSSIEGKNSRSLNGKAILAANRALAATARCSRAIDAAFAAAVATLRAELPDAEAEAREVAINLNSDDDEAVRIAKILASAARLARDEQSMCDAVAAAFTTVEPTDPKASKLAPAS